MKKEKYKIFESKDNSAFKDCIDAGYRPLTTKETIDAQTKRLIPMQWYDTSTFFVRNKDGEVIDMKDYTPKEIIAWLKGEIDARPLVLDGNFLNSGDFFDVIRRVPGVLVEDKKTSTSTKTSTKLALKKEEK